VPTASEPDLRTNALSAFLAERVARGYKIETQADTHAIIVAPRRLANGFGLRRATSHDRRQVVSVDEAGIVTTEPAEPIRW
jgi:hypothetical protein